MRLSVLIPVFNTADYVIPALESASGQTHGDFEILVIDDGSTDGSGDLLRAYADREPRMRLLSRANRGLIETRNQLVAEARGELVAWMDSDDVSDPDRLRFQHQRMLEDPSLVCVGADAQCIDPSGAPLNVERYPLTHAEIVAAQSWGAGMRFPTTMMRRDAILAVGGFREPFRMGEDLDLLLRLGEHGRLANLGKTLYRYRQHASSVTATLSARWFVYLAHILELARQRREDGIDVLQAGGSIEIPPVEQPQFKRAVATTYLYWVSCALAHHDRGRALRYAFRALRSDPFGRGTWRSLVKAALASRDLWAFRSLL